MSLSAAILVEEATHLSGTVCTFLTHDGGRPLTFGVIADLRHDDDAVRSAYLGDLARAAQEHPGACAYGKIAVLGKEGIFTFQADVGGETVAAFCGNSTAAALSLLGGDGPIRTKVHGAGPAPYEISARIEHDTVVQSWIVPAHDVEERYWRGRRVIFLSTLNDYAIVEGSLPAGTTPETARHELLGASGCGKLAVIRDMSGASIVEFYNSNGKHGAAPQTGLATIALAARARPWFHDQFPDGRLTYLTQMGPRQAPLPPVSEADDGRLMIEIPSITVSVDVPTLKLVA